MFFWVGKADTNPGQNDTISPDELDDYQAEVGLDGYDNVVFTDGDSETSNGTHVWNSFVDGNQDLVFGSGIPIVFRKNMTIGAINGTYDWDTYPLSDIQSFLEE